MPLYAIEGESLTHQKPSNFGELGILERADLQRLLRQQAAVLGEDLKIIAEEFGNWEDSKRRIDLLALDRSARLVVIELKRTIDGGHMELQALRYAAMISAMTFDEAVAAYSVYRALHSTASETPDARTDLADFLGQDPSDEIEISSEVRILLVSADFGREITTAVLWLNSFDRMDIRCVRLVPYKLGQTVYIDVEQVIPLPEAADYQVRLRKKDNAQARSQSGADGRDFTRYQLVVDGEKGPAENKRNAVRSMITALHSAGIPCSELAKELSNQEFRQIDGQWTTVEDVRSQLEQRYPNADPNRWFCDTPIVDQTAQRTYVVWKMWGANTEEKLERLSAAFPHAKIGFAVAD